MESEQEIHSGRFGDGYRQDAEQFRAGMQSNNPLVAIPSGVLFGLGYGFGAALDTMHLLFPPTSEPSKFTKYDDGTSQLEMGSPSSGDLMGQGLAITGLGGVRQTTVRGAKPVAESPTSLNRPPLRRIHPDTTYDSDVAAKKSLDYWRTRPTDEIVNSLAPGAKQPLTTKADGRIYDGNTRIKVLEERGFDVNSLPRVELPPNPLDDLFK